MFDPNTVVGRLGPFTLWHVDPERGGSDDSCGYTFPRLTDQQRRRIRDRAWWEGRYPYFLRCPAKLFNGPRSEAETLYRALVLEVATCVGVNLSIEEATRAAIEAIHNGHESDGAAIFCFVAGYHTAVGEDTPDERQEHFAGIMCGIARGVLRRRRRWWQQPRWHFWHWRLQPKTGGRVGDVEY